METFESTIENMKRELNNIPLPPLPYPLDALSPYISEETLQLHYKKHNRSYVDTLNSIKHGTVYNKLNLEEIILKSSDAASEFDKKIFNNASQAWNHAFYWQCLSDTHNMQPSDDFMKVLSENFKSFDNFKAQFTKAALDQFGSGWVWLVEDDQHTLEIMSTSNAENPLTQGLIPLLVCDVWEHAYYLDYKNERNVYLENFWPLVSWRFVENGHQQV